MGGYFITFAADQVVIFRGDICAKKVDILLMIPGTMDLFLLKRALSAMSATCSAVISVLDTKEFTLVSATSKNSVFVATGYSVVTETLVPFNS